ncbi:MAG TPA: EscU/YscU/HrcU family type III secretion system export apparatus switch protein [Acidobacteriaceae bacterium]|nr:EscU/YscU/HrcU family type III secretion system export apparatus switch protein [Acidobacteriaceae bacterium]
MAGERTEQASPQRREKARREGDILHSRELTGAAGMLAGVLLLGWAMPRFLDRWLTALAGFLSYGAAQAWEPEKMEATLGTLLRLTIAALVPVGVAALAVASAALGVGVLQTGGLQVHPQLVGFKIERLSPWSNLKSLFSLRSAARLGKSLIPAFALGIYAYVLLKRQWLLPPFSSQRLVDVGKDAYNLLLAAAWVLFAWSAVDYFVERHSREERLKMSRQEQRDEFKESEGNPQIRARIRNLQRLARRRRLQADVARAAVVITNPTHYAVALDFNFESMEAPTVLAKGQNLIAEEIKEQARWAGVPIIENPPLARSLYRLVEPGEQIPFDLYAAVASILAFLYRQRVEEEIRQRRRAARPAPQPSTRPQPARTVIPATTPRRPRRARVQQNALPETPKRPTDPRGKS